MGVVGVGGDYSPCPGAGVELAGGGVSVVSAFSVGVLLAGEETGGLVVDPSGGVACWRGGWPGGCCPKIVIVAGAVGGHCCALAVGVVSVFHGVVGFAPGAGWTSEGIIGAVAHLTEGVFNRLDLPGSVFHRSVIGEVGSVACGIRLAGDEIRIWDIGYGRWGGGLRICTVRMMRLLGYDDAGGPKNHGKLD